MIIPPNERRGPLYDAIVIARHFFEKTGAPEFGKDGVPLECLIKATRKYTRDHLGHEHFIEIHGGNWAKFRFWSMLFRTKSQSTILVHHSLNWCYTRFAIAIELSNIIMSDDESLNTSDLVANLAGLRSGIAASGPLMGEKVAIPLAIELLLPMQHRHHWEKRLATGKSAFEIAERFRVPEFIVDWSMKGGWQLRSDIHKDLDDQEKNKK